MLIPILLKIQVLASLVMLVFWLIEVKTKDASLVDVAWSMTIAMTVIFTLFNLPEYHNKPILIAFLVLIWAIRLSYHLINRIRKIQQEDSRYQKMRQAMGQFAHVGFFFFYQVQSVFVTIFATPIVISLMSNSAKVLITDFIGLLILTSAIVGESIADHQLLKFKSNVKNKNKTCNIGLWYYSRHPNYFFEWLHWFAYPLFSFHSNAFWLCCFAPLLILFFLFKVTGIPHIERIALKSKPDYSDYMKTTSKFIPWFKKGINDA